MAVSFDELEGSPSIKISNQGGFTATRKFRVAWADWKTAAAELVGGWIFIGGERVFNNPKQFPGFPEAVVLDLSIDPYDPSNPNPAGTTNNIVTFDIGLN